MDITKYEKIFSEESEKYLKGLVTLLIQVEKDLGRDELWGEIHGKVHSIKGMSRALSLDKITHLSHSIENWCKQFQEGVKSPTPDTVQLILDGAELLRLLVAKKGNIDSPENQKWYDTLISRFEKDPEEMPKESPPGETSRSSIPSFPERIDQVRVKYPLIEELLGFSQEILLLENRLPPLPKGSPGLKNWIDHYTSMLKALYFRLAGLRLMSVGDFAELFVKSIRNLAKQYNKQVAGEVIGGEVQADIALLERLREPFIHLLRNSIVHGIEPPEERIRAGKKAEGKITLEASSERDSLVIKITDDGRGIDRSAITKYLKGKRSLTDKEIVEMPEEAFLNTILSTDFSSAYETSDMAGRGIGMSVVTQAIEYLGGSMTIRSEPSKGTEFVFRLPLYLSVIYALSFKIGKYALSIPTIYVESIDRRESILPEGDDSFFDLRGLLGVEARNEKLSYVLNLSYPEDPHAFPPREGPGNNGHIHLEADSIIGNRPIMVMPVGELVARAGVFSGVGIMENGDLSILFDMQSLSETSLSPGKGHGPHNSR